jgi:hypothetical protein
MSQVLPVYIALGITGMNLMRLFVPLVAVCCFATPYAEATELRTPTYVVKITENCQEGEVGCRDVKYVGTNIKTGKSITLKGKAVMRMCPDRVTPCSHDGYTFKNGSVEYRVTPDGLLVVSHGTKVLVEELGEWQR